MTRPASAGTPRPSKYPPVTTCPSAVLASPDASTVTPGMAANANKCSSGDAGSCCCVWNAEKEKYAVYYGKLIESPNTGDRHRDVYEMTAAFTAEMEKFIRAYPEQWLWIHKRWKSRPDSEPELY